MFKLQLLGSYHKVALAQAVLRPLVTGLARLLLLDRRHSAHGDSSQVNLEGSVSQVHRAVIAALVRLGLHGLGVGET